MRKAPGKGPFLGTRSPSFDGHGSRCRSWGQARSTGLWCTPCRRSVTTVTVPDAPILNARGQPWTSRGRRNLAWVGSGFGNGGVTPPGRYERRRGCIGSDEHHDTFWMSDWRRLLAHLRHAGAISPNAYEVGSHLADFSNERGEHTWPSQATIGKRLERSASTVGRALAELRAAGVVEWDHRFEGPTNEIPRPHPTSNMYEFRIPLELARAANLKRRIQRMTKRRPQRRPGGHRSGRSPGP